MGMDDLIEDSKQDTEQKKIAELKEELGIEDKEDLEEYSDRMSIVVSTMMAHDKKIEKLEDEIKVLRKTILETASMIEESSCDCDGSNGTEQEKTDQNCHSDSGGDMLWE